MIDEIDEIIYTHIDDQHPDTLRFLHDCEEWFGKKITILQSPLKSVENACRQANFINGVHGASCTRLLKRRVRAEWEVEHTWFNQFRYVWGMDLKETKRADDLRESMPEQEHIFSLIDKGMTKKNVHGIIKSSGIKRPEMYNMGYPNNNCVGCVRGGAGYWNKIREDFPEVFESRAKMERELNITSGIGARCMNRCFLDELPKSKGRKLKPIVAECGIFCELKSE
jgi:hypothetical protein